MHNEDREQTVGAPPASAGAKDGIVSSGWLASSSVFGTQDDHRIKRAFGATVVSTVAHGLILAFLIFLATQASSIVTQPPSEPLRVVYLQDPGPGGGGGGSPAPAPPKPISIPKTRPPDPVPVVVPPPEVVPPPPIPRLNAPIITSGAQVVQAPGTSSVSLAENGGGGRGRGVGSGRGDGVGPGTGGGFGDGFYGPGSGVTWPTVVKEMKPTYTPEAMRLKLQGEVRLEVEILANGTVGNVRVKKSLDKAHGLDEEAMRVAKLWLFRPAYDRTGKSVPVIGEIIISFNLH